MVVVATSALTIAHPGRCFQGCWSLPVECSREDQSEMSYSIQEWQRKSPNVTGEMLQQSIKNYKSYAISIRGLSSREQLRSDGLQC